jgi:hypothetical protein
MCFAVNGCCSSATSNTEPPRRRATVKVQAGGRTLTQYADGKSGYFEHSPLPLYFGLGEATKVDRVEVVWPAGGRQTLTKDLPVNALLTVTEARQ